MNNTTTKTIYSFYSFCDKMFLKCVIFGHFCEKMLKTGDFLPSYTVFTCCSDDTTTINHGTSYRFLSAGSLCDDGSHYARYHSS